jgi:hypothetical protein
MKDHFIGSINRDSLVETVDEEKEDKPRKK